MILKMLLFVLNSIQYLGLTVPAPEVCAGHIPCLSSQFISSKLPLG